MDQKSRLPKWARISLIEVPSAGHVTAWNVDPESYEITLAGFLTTEVGV